MPSKKKNNSPKPQFRLTKKSFFYDKKIYYPRFPTIYQLELPSEYKYTKIYDVLYEFYFESFREQNKEPIINRDQIFLYGYLQSLANRGKSFSVKNLAAFVQMNTNKLVEHLDRLEDALLIHRVQRLDLHGKPNDLIVHTPPMRHVWEGGLREKILKRTDTEEARLSRKETGYIKEYDDGDKRLFIPRGKQKFSFNYTEVFKNTFDGDEQASEDFAESILISLCHDKELILQDAKKYDDLLRQRVNESFRASNMTATERHYKAAITLRKIYAPVISEFGIKI